MKIASFLSGLNSGIETGSRIADLVKQYGINKARKDAISEAEAARQADINSSITLQRKDVQPMVEPVNTDYQKSYGTESTQPELINPAIQGLQANKFNQPTPSIVEPQETNLVNPSISSMTNQQVKMPATQQEASQSLTIDQTKGMGAISGTPDQYKFKVGEGSYDNRADAQKAAEKLAEDPSYYFAKKVSPAMYKAYMEAGEPEKAAAWNSFSEGELGKGAIKSWAKGFTKLQAGDFDGGASSFGNFYTKYIDDGVDYTGHKTLKDGDGNVTGFTIELKNKESGKTSELPMSKNELIALAQQHNPQKMFEDIQAKQKAAELRVITIADKVAEENRKAVIDAGLANIKANVNAQNDIKKEGMRKDTLLSVEGLRAENRNNSLTKEEKNADYIRKTDGEEAAKQYIKNTAKGTQKGSAVDESRARLEAMKYFKPAGKQAARVRVVDEAGQPKSVAFDTLPKAEQDRLMNERVDAVMGRSGTGTSSSPSAPSSPSSGENPFQIIKFK